MRHKKHRHPRRGSDIHFSGVQVLPQRENGDFSSVFRHSEKSPFRQQKPRQNRGFRRRHLFCLHIMVGEGGFEPPKHKAADLQSVPFGHSGTLPYLWRVFYYSTRRRDCQGFFVIFAIFPPHCRGGKIAHIQWVSLSGFGGFMVRLMRFCGTSTLSTHTFTMSPTFSTSKGCLINLSVICEMCTSPS